MKPLKSMIALFSISILLLSFSGCNHAGTTQAPVLNESGYFEAPGVNYLVFSNWYNGLFGDSKMSGIEVIHHEVRTVTNGDVRLSPTPEQWDPIPVFVERNVDSAGQVIEAILEYPGHGFTYRISAEIEEGALAIRVLLDEPLPASLEGRAGFNLEFLPSAYFNKTFMMDEKVHAFPIYAAGSMEKLSNGTTRPLPLATGRELVLAPDDPEMNIRLTTHSGDISFYDGRNKAQNGWFVARTMIPAGKTGAVVEWKLRANAIDNWQRKPMIAHSQVGYHPGQQKVAVIELDRNSRIVKNAELFEVRPDGTLQGVTRGKVEEWGPYLRYNYVTFDFSEITKEGTYVIEYAGVRSDPILVSENVYKNAWQPTLDIYFPVQMDHVLVNEAYRVWHGASHLDDARQAPVNHEHFDLYGQGPTTDTRYKPGEHIPGLNVGGWFDAGDYDIRTQTQYGAVMGLVQVWENFGIERDQTLVDYDRKYVDIHVPDGRSDLLQQIEHGAIGLLAQHKAVGHAIPGIIVPDISQYTHLGDALTMTDNMIYDPRFSETQSDGRYSGVPDDRWAFTNRSSSLNYGSAAALAATFRALKEYNPAFAVECLKTAKKVWDEENSKEPDVFRVGNTTGGFLQVEQLRAAVELLEATGDEKYSNAVAEKIPLMERFFRGVAPLAVRAIPYMDGEYLNTIEGLVKKHKAEIDSIQFKNPFGVPITRGGWAGNGSVMGHSVTNYYLYKAFPEIIEKEDVFKGLNYLYGCHPGHNISFVSGVGVRSKMVAYGMNRADYSYIAGGIVPGSLILPPDFPENKEDWPFLWGENEYVISMGASYIFAVKAVEELLR
ncbi:MAG: glycoside hydrolase family 9 protein [Bacteroidales bacterium]|nr:glycoside hydrolase family 9 protein [Bacteroidales bacterium]